MDNTLTVIREEVTKLLSKVAAQQNKLEKIIKKQEKRFKKIRAHKDFILVSPSETAPLVLIPKKEYDQFLAGLKVAFNETEQDQESLENKATVLCIVLGLITGLEILESAIITANFRTIGKKANQLVKLTKESPMYPEDESELESMNEKKIKYELMVKKKAIESIKSQDNIETLIEIRNKCFEVAEAVFDRNGLPVNDLFDQVIDHLQTYGPVELKPATGLQVSKILTRN